MSFDLRIGPFTVQHLWVLFLRFPSDIWSKDVFHDLGNQLGKFMYYNKASMERVDKRIA